MRWDCLNPKLSYALKTLGIYDETSKICYFSGARLTVNKPKKGAFLERMKV